MKKETVITATITGIMLLAAWLAFFLIVGPWLVGFAHGWAGGPLCVIGLMLGLITMGWGDEFFPGA